MMLDTIDSDIAALRQSFHQAAKSSAPCPLCGCDESWPLVNADRHDLGLNLVACRHCGLGMISPRPDSEWFDKFYADNYWPVYISSRFQDLQEMFREDRCEERAREIFDSIAASIPKTPKKFLDVGCGQGAMLAEFRRRYPNAVCVGAETSPDAVQFCRQHHQVDVECVNWSALRADQLLGPFDLITLIHVLEHVPNPVSALMHVVQRMSDTGMIYVEVPDLLSDRWASKEFFHIAHVWYFHETALRNLFQRCGLEVVEVIHGATEVWPWAIGLVGRKLSEGVFTADALAPVAETFCQRLREHVAYRLYGGGLRLCDTPPPHKPSLLHSALTAEQHAPKSTMKHLLQTRVHKWLRKYSSVRVDEILALQRQLEAKEQLLDFVSAEDSHRWLYANRQERMDATLPIFDAGRREFHLERYRFAASRVAGRRVVDCASGTGYGIRVLVELGGPLSAVGIEIDPQAVAYARKKHAVPKAQFLCASGDRMPLTDRSIDLVTSFETIEHVPDDVTLLDEFYRVLRPGGLLIISTPNQWPLAVSPFHLREYDRASFLKVLSRRFDCVELYNQNSGSPTPYNHQQAAGMVVTTAANEHLAECYVAVCRRNP